MCKIFTRHSNWDFLNHIEPRGGSYCYELLRCRYEPFLTADLGLTVAKDKPQV